MSETIEELEAEAKRLGQAWRDVTRRLHKARLAAAGVSVGDIVRTGNGKLFRVAVVQVFPTGRPWLVGNPQRVDGSFGTAKRNLYGGWELVPGDKPMLDFRPDGEPPQILPDLRAEP